MSNVVRSMDEELTSSRSSCGVWQPDPFDRTWVDEDAQHALAAALLTFHKQAEVRSAWPHAVDDEG